MEWQQPHWSGRPQASGAPQQKLRPNGFARMARFSAENRLVVLALYILVTVLCGGFAAATLEIDPDEGPRITLDAATAASQAELERQFPGIDRTFLAIVESGDADTSRAQAVALAASLARQGEFFASAFVPVFLAVSLVIFFVFGLVYRHLTRHMPGAVPLRFGFSRVMR